MEAIASTATYGFQIQFSSYHRMFSIASAVSDVDNELATLGLTPTLEGYVKGLRNVADDKVRYQQMFFMASKIKPMDQSLKIEANKIPGCLSTAYIHATRENGKIYFQGDSDAMMTKGLVAMLVNGLSGCTNEEIQRVKPEFIQFAGIGASMTPGRNNGFLNMMKVLKTKAERLHNEMVAGQTESEDTTQSTNGVGPIYQAIVTKLGMLKPEELIVEDESSRHAGHAGMQGSTVTESHFNVRIIASCFDGLSLVQRHKMVYTLLSQEMNGGIHALSIYAKTPTEEMNKNK